MTISSYTLIQLGIEHNLDPCKSCKNAVWQAFKDNKIQIKPYTNKNFDYNQNKLSLSCWCILLHDYITEGRVFCDGNAPEEEPTLDEFLKNTN